LSIPKNISNSKRNLERLGANPFKDIQNALKNLTESGGFAKLSNDIDGFVSSLKAVDTTLEEVKNTLGATISDFEAYSAGIGRAQAYQEDYNKAVLKAIQNQNFLEESNKDLNKSFGMSSKGAIKFAHELRKLGKDIKVGSDKLFKYADSLKGITGGFIASSKANANFVNELVKTQTYLQNNLGLSEENAQSFELYAAGIGKSGAEAAGAIDEMSRALEGVTGIDAVQMQKQIIEDISSMGADLQLQYGRVGSNLETATMKARLLGTTMEQLHGTGKGLLEIESSIGAEMEYQQLTGRRLLDNQGKSLTNEYRMATITGDSTKQAELMNQFIESEGETLEKNLFARQKAAQLMGTDEATLAKMIQKRKLAVKLGAEEIMNMSADEAKTEIERLRKDAKGDEDKLKDIDDLIKMSDTRTTAETANDLLEQIRDRISVSGVTAVGVETAQQGVVSARLDVLNENSPLIKFATDASKTFANKEFIQGIGSLGIAADRITAVSTPLKQLADTKIPILSKKLTTVANSIGTLTSVIKDPYTSTVLTTDNKAAGGYISGPGTGTSDSIPARLSDGEYVINAASTRRNRALLDKINNTPIKMAGGGVAMSTARMENLLSSILTAIRGNGIMGETSLNNRKRV